MTEAAAKEWNRLRFLVDDHRTGHVYTPFQNIPELNPWLSSYAQEFRRAPIPLAEARTYSHIFSPFIWRVVKYYKILHPEDAANIPDIPDEWLSYGHQANIQNSLSETTFRNSEQTNNPRFFGIGDPAQEAFWVSKIVSAAENPQFIEVLFRNMRLRLPVELQAPAPPSGSSLVASNNSNSSMQRQIQASLISFAEEQRKKQGASVLSVAPRQQLPSMENVMLESSIEAVRKLFQDNGLPRNSKSKEQIVQALTNSNRNIDRAFNSLAFSGGKRNKRRQTKRKSRKQKRKSTYRRRR